MRKDADCVLYEVNRKKTDARKQVSLLAALVKLRAVREQTAVQRGEKISLEDKTAFALATGLLFFIATFLCFRCQQFSNFCCK